MSVARAAFLISLAILDWYCIQGSIAQNYQPPFPPPPVQAGSGISVSNNTVSLTTPSLTGMTPQSGGGGVNAAYSNGTNANLAAAALISAMGLGTAALVATGAFDAAGTAATLIAALNLQSASQQPSSAFYGSGNPSGFQTVAQVAASIAAAAYALPTATSSILGGVKIGGNVTVAGDGTISVAAPYNDAQASAAAPVQSVCGNTGSISSISGCTGGYTLPAATTSTLGGVKAGAGLNIAGDGTLSAVVQSVVGLTGTITQGTLQAALSLGSAAYQASNAFDAAGAAAAAVVGLAPLSSPALTGSPTAPTQTAGDATTKIATDAFVGAAITAAAPASPCTTGSKIACGTGSTAASTGVWSATLTPACSSTPLTVEAVAKAASTALSSSVTPSITSFNSTTVSGIATAPATLSILGLTVIAPPTATPIYVMAVCP